MRIITLIVSLVTAVIVIALLSRILPPAGAAILLDINRSTWPLTVQNILWLAFFAGLGESAEDLQPFDPDLFVDGILPQQE